MLISFNVHLLEIKQMDTGHFYCYYQGCGKEYQSQAILVRHINSFHLNQTIIKCPLCTKYLISVDEYQKHMKKHGKNRGKRFSSTFLLSEHYKDEIQEINPVNVMKFPVLPPIENERKDPKFVSKLPMSPEILTELLKK